MERALIPALLALRAQAQSGVLAVRAEGVRTFIYLLRGEPVFAEEETMGETLGRLLVRQNKLTQDQYVRIIERMTSGIIDNEQLRFGEVAVELGFMSAEEVQRALADQVRWKIIRTLQRSDHEFAFQASTGQVDAVMHFPLVLEALILEACRWIPDERKMPALEAVGDRFVTLGDEPAALAKKFLMTPEERDFLVRIDGNKTMRALSALPSDADCPALLAALLWAGGVKLATAPAPKKVEPLRPLTPAQPVMPAPAAAPRPPGAGPIVVPTPQQFVPFKHQAIADAGKSPAAPPVAPPPTPPSAPSSATASAPDTGARDAAKERADRALALLRQQRAGGAVRPPTPGIPFTPPNATKPEPKKPTDAREAKLLAEQEFQRGKQHLATGQHKLAQTELERAHDLMPDSAEYELYALWAAFLTGTADEAARASLKRVSSVAVKANPNLAFGYFVMGEMALADKSEAVAKKMFTHAVKLDPNQLDAARRLRLLNRK